MLLDSSTGDPDDVLSDVALAIDAWFTGTRPGVSSIASQSDIAPLVSAGILGVIADAPAALGMRVPGLWEMPKNRP